MRETTGFSRVEFQFPPNQAGGSYSKRPPTLVGGLLPMVSHVCYCPSQREGI